MITVVNPWHWLEEDGSLPVDARVRRRALRVAQCIEAGGPLEKGHARETLIACRKRPERQPCPGLLCVLKQPDDAIHAFCGHCRADEFLIYEWENTPWAHGPAKAIDIATPAEAENKSPPTAGPHNVNTRLARALKLVGSRLGPADVRRMISTSEHPTEVIQAVLSSLSEAPSQSTLERLMPVIIEVWNATPRAQLHGRSPDEMFASAPRPAPATRPSSASIGRNEPCRCGSGKKYKRCCLRNAPN